jgi:cobalt/nickel transport system ATP-binding protein
MTPEPAPLIRFTEVGFAYPGKGALFSGLTLALHPGERLGLIGPIGSGKTTIFHLMAGLLKACAGTIEMFGRARTTDADFDDARTRVGLLFQEPDDQLFCPTVREEIAFGPLNLGKSPAEADAIAQEVMARIGLAGFDEAITHRLSGGEKRLVTLASVLAMNPRVLLLDEPTNGLDPRGRRALRALLRELPVAQIIATHDMELVADLCPRVIAIDHGQIIAEGPTPDVLNNEPLMLQHGLERPHILRHHHPHP